MEKIISRCGNQYNIITNLSDIFKKYLTCNHDPLTEYYLLATELINISRGLTISQIISAHLINNYSSVGMCSINTYFGDKTKIWTFPFGIDPLVD